MRKHKRELEYLRSQVVVYEACLENIARLNLSNREARGWLIHALGYLTYVALVDDAARQKAAEHGHNVSMADYYQNLT